MATCTDSKLKAIWRHPLHDFDTDAIILESDSVRWPSSCVHRQHLAASCSRLPRGRRYVGSRFQTPVACASEFVGKAAASETLPRSSRTHFSSHFSLSHVLIVFWEKVLRCEANRPHCCVSDITSRHSFQAWRGSASGPLREHSHPVEPAQSNRGRPQTMVAWPGLVRVAGPQCI